MLRIPLANVNFLGKYSFSLFTTSLEKPNWSLIYGLSFSRTNVRVASLKFIGRLPRIPVTIRYVFDDAKKSVRFGEADHLTFRPLFVCFRPRSS